MTLRPPSGPGGASLRLVSVAGGLENNRVTVCLRVVPLNVVFSFTRVSCNSLMICIRRAMIPSLREGRANFQATGPPQNSAYRSRCVCCAGAPTQLRGDASGGVGGQGRITASQNFGEIRAIANGRLPSNDGSRGRNLVLSRQHR